MKNLALTAVIASLLLPLAAQSDTLSGGSATIDYDKTAWDTLASGFGVGQPVLTLSSFFNQAESNARTAAQLLSDPSVNSSYLNQVYAMNGSTVNNLSGRNTQPTTFDFTPGNLAAHTGSIGLGGVARFGVTPAAGGGNLLYGDFTLQYDINRVGLGGTGWYLKGNIAPAAAAFDLLNVNIVESPGSFTISGDLGVSFEVANFLYNTPSDTLKDIGNFSFTGTVAPVPEPSSMALLGVGGLLLAAKVRRQQR